MKIIRFLEIVIFVLEGSNFWNKKIDIAQAKKLVYLSKIDLQNFSQLRQQLISDSTAIRKQNNSTTARQIEQVGCSPTNFI